MEEDHNEQNNHPQDVEKITTEEDPKVETNDEPRSELQLEKF